MTTLTCPAALHKNSKLVKNLLEKKQLLDNNDPAHKKYKTALVLQGGVFLGVYGAGVCCGLEAVGMADAFDYIIGVSTGTVTGAYFLSRQIDLGTSIFHEDLTDGRFLNFRRPRKILDMDYLNDIFLNQKPLRTEPIVASRTELLLAVTDISTGKGEVLRAKDEDIDIVATIKAAMSIPGLYNQPTLIKEKVYCDGIYGFTNPVDYAVNQLGCTDVVVVTNRSCGFRRDSRALAYAEAITARTLLRKLSP